MHEVLVNRLGGLSLPRKSVVRLTDRPDMILDVYRGCKTTMQQQQHRLTLILYHTNVLYDNILDKFEFECSSQGQGHSGYFTNKNIVIALSLSFSYRF